jgi:hypothetical protein
MPYRLSPCIRVSGTYRIEKRIRKMDIKKIWMIIKWVLSCQVEAGVVLVSFGFHAKCDAINRIPHVLLFHSVSE